MKKKVTNLIFKTIFTSKLYFLKISLPELTLLKSAMTIPKAHSNPPPAKSASKLIGGVGTVSFRPRVDKIPKIHHKFRLDSVTKIISAI